MNNPLVSVLMTVYNREKYIAEAIESVINSSYQNWELIIVDDQSKDRSVEIARHYVQKDERIRLYINEVNLGDYPNRNRAASYAKGKYLKYLDSDDIIYPHGLAVMVEAMEKNPEAVMAFPDFKESGKYRLPYAIEPHAMYQRHYFEGGLLYTGPTGAIYRADFFVSVNGFDPTYGVASDLAFNLLAASSHPAVVFQRDLFWWRPHDGQEINTKKDHYELLNEKINHCFLTHSKCPLTLKEASVAYYNLKTIQARRVLMDLVKLKFKRVIAKKSLLNVANSFLFLAVLPNRLRVQFYPNEIR